MARAPSSGPPRAIFKSPASLIKAALTLGVVGSTLGASLLVASVTQPSSVRLPSLAGPSYARDVAGFHPVSRSLTHEIGATPAPTPVPSAKPAPHLPSSKPVDSQPSAPAPSHSPSPSAPLPSLTVAIATSASVTHPNKTITYTITITNAGPGIANDVVVESHVPDGTSLSSWMCNGSIVTANGADHFTCGTLGSAPAPNHPLVFAVSALAPGSTIIEQFTVQVDHNVNHNSVIVDHAHAYAANADLSDSNQASVIVK
jgi:uncharacterized repeat protein (TIGR01451 family)